MSMQTERNLSTGWSRSRDSGSTVREVVAAAAKRRLGVAAVRNLSLNQALSLGAAIALARQGSRATFIAVRRHPLVTLLGAVALVSAGVALVVAQRQRQRQRERGNGVRAGARTTQRVAAKNLRGTGVRVAAVKTAQRATRVRNARSKVTH